MVVPPALLSIPRVAPPRVTPPRAHNSGALEAHSCNNKPTRRITALQPPIDSTTQSNHTTTPYKQRYALPFHPTRRRDRRGAPTLNCTANCGHLFVVAGGSTPATRVKQCAYINYIWILLRRIVSLAGVSNTVHVPCNTTPMPQCPMSTTAKQCPKQRSLLLIASRMRL